MSTRVFVSYAHEDRDLAESVCERLNKIGMKPLKDSEFSLGLSITNQVKNKIAYAHILLPIISKNSVLSHWVQFEIGYATGMGVPILPLCVDTGPIEPLSDTLGLFTTESLSGIEKLDVHAIERVVSEGQENSRSVFESAFHPEERTQMIVSLSETVREMAGYQRIRHSSAFSSFSIPDRIDYLDLWKSREGDIHTRTPYLRELLRNERQQLEMHANEGSCDLIVAPFLSTRKLTEEMQVTRLEILRDFVLRMPEHKIKLVVRTDDLDENFLAVGNWFYAESFTPRTEGFVSTIFTRHAPTVLNRIDMYDKSFAQQYAENHNPDLTPKADALEKLDKAIKILNTPPLPEEPWVQP